MVHSNIITMQIHSTSRANCRWVSIAKALSLRIIYAMATFTQIDFFIRFSSVSWFCYFLFVLFDFLQYFDDFRITHVICQSEWVRSMAAARQVRSIRYSSVCVCEFWIMNTNFNLFWKNVNKESNARNFWIIYCYFMIFKYLFFESDTRFILNHRETPGSEQT